MTGAEWRALEDVWGMRVRSASDRYHQAFRHHVEILRQKIDGDQLRRAARAERIAFEQYRQSLEVFTDLVLRRKRPPEE